MSMVYVVKRETFSNGHVLTVARTLEQGVKDAREAIKRDSVPGAIYEVIEQKVGRVNRQGSTGTPIERVVARVRKALDGEVELVEMDDVRAIERLKWASQE